MGCASVREEPLQRFAFEQPQMGVPFQIVLYATDSARAEAAALAAFGRIEELNAIMSDYETDSELSLLSLSSEAGGPEVPVSADLWKVLKFAQQISALSDGAFDITIGPCAALWRKARREKELPEPARLASALGKVGFRNLLLNEESQSARLVRYGMRLDLGGIAKGYAADEALKVLEGHGIQRALVAASGDLALGDPPPGEEGWRVEIAAYDAPDSPPSAVFQLARCGVATSGDLFQRVEIGGIRYSHVVNPFTCIGMTNHALATVVAPDCMTADVLATTSTLVDDTETALALANRFKGALRVIRSEGEQRVLRANERFEAIAGHTGDGAPFRH